MCRGIRYNEGKGGVAVSRKELNGIAVAGAILSDGTEKPVCAGCVPNVSTMVKKLFPKTPVSAIGVVGDDVVGQYAISCMQSAGVDTSGVRIGDASGNFGIGDMVFRDLSCKILHLDYCLMMDKIVDGDGRKILKHARNCGMETSLSMQRGVSDRYAAVLAALPYADYFVVSLEDGAWLTKMDPETDGIEKIARRLLWYGVKKKVFVFSDQWVACCTKTQYDLLGNFILPEGNFICDAFYAGALMGLQNGWSDMRILEFSTACAAAAKTGAQMETAKDAANFCRQLTRYKRGCLINDFV